MFKTMNILFITDNFSSGGLETHIETYFKALKERYPVNILFTSSFKSQPYFKSVDLFADKIFNIEIKDYSAASILKLKEQIDDIIKHNPIDLIHTHPFISTISSFMSAVEFDIPLAFTLHGKLSLFSPDGASNVFLRNIIFENALGFSVNPSIIPEESNINYLPNPIDENFWRTGKIENTDYALIVSRLDKEKTKAVDSAIEKLKKADIRIVIAGDGSEKKSLEEKHKDIQFVGFKFGYELKELMEQAAFVCGMGRVVLESLFLSKPTVLLNYEGNMTLIDDNTFKEAEKFNFNGSNMIEEENILEKLKSILEEKMRPSINSEYLKNFSSSIVVEDYFSYAKDFVSSFKGYSSYVKSSTTLFENYLKKASKSEKLSKENLDIKETNTKLKNDIRVYQKEIKEYIKGIEERDKNIARLDGNIKQLIDEKADLETRFIEMQNENNRLFGLLSDIYNSKFWKMAKAWYNFKDKTVSIFKKTKDNQQNDDFLNKLEEILSNRDWNGVVIYPPTVDWNIPLFQRPQHFALNFSKFNFLYFHCTPNAGYDDVRGFQKVDEGVYLTNEFSKLIEQISNYDLSVYFILPSTNLTVDIDMLRHIKNDLGFYVIYDYIDEIHASITYGNTNFIKKRHEKLTEKDFNLILCVSLRLFEEMKEKFNNNERVLLIENGVDYEHFHISQSSSNVPKKIEKIVGEKKPIIGYYGALAKWIDYDLLNYVAEKRQDINFLLIGVDYDGSLKQLNSELENMYYIGSVPYMELPFYAIWFDVAIIPFKMGNIAKSTSPLKMYEYMSLNKPLICTKDLLECGRYKTPLISVDKNDFERKIDEALVLKDDENYIKLLNKEAKENTWEIRVKTIIRAFNKGD